MDKGARFYRCDFQVHSPRDIRWNGAGAATEEERKAYAEELIARCREIGLDAIAITDHHDLVFFPYIKEAAESEEDEAGMLVSSEKRIIVFPGVELTLSTPPCQALLLLDSNFPIREFDAILHSLGLAPNPPEESKTAQVTPITNDLVSGLRQLYSRLDSIASLKGRYIVLPNVSEGGRHTLLRAGNAEHYKKMPCVGGYLDGILAQHGIGNTNIVNGVAREWGNKSIGIFQTSDNRSRSHDVLGEPSTWIKWAEPTAEALRQACLAKESRLSQENPVLPQTFITKLDVTNSKFFGSFSISFNRQYNALIGGRGTGKSTILEYLRWGLCDKTVSNSENQTSFEKRSRELIEKTLLPFGGEVRVTAIVNGVEFIVKRSSVEGSVFLKQGDGDFEEVSEDEVRRLFPVQAYSQKQLSSVGIRIEELKRFIELPISGRLNDLKFQTEDISKKMKVSFNNYLRKRQVEVEISKLSLENKSLIEQVKALRSSLVGLTPADQVIVSQKTKYDLEKNLIEQTKNDLNEIEGEVETTLEAVKTYLLDEEINDSLYENKDEINLILSKKNKKIKLIISFLEKAKNELAEAGLKEIRGEIGKWTKIEKKYLTAYEKSKVKAAANKAKLEEIQKIEARVQFISKTLVERGSRLRQLGNPEKLFNDETEKWYSLHTEKASLLNSQTEKFSRLSQGLISANVMQNIDIKPLKSLLMTHLVGSRIPEIKIDELFDSISRMDSPIDGWRELLDELRELSEIVVIEGGQLPECKILDIANFSEKHKTNIATILDSEAWLELATEEVEFNPEFKYVADARMEDVIPFADASAGQQATALLTVLLNQSGSPLIIDQPEDDIDNKAVKEIIERIWSAKQNRQLIFTSHNANLVVNGDAELVICCDYREAGNQTRGEIKAEGAIDTAVVREEITTVMEGGEKAFRLRKEKYGF